MRTIACARSLPNALIPALPKENYSPLSHRERGDSMNPPDDNLAAAMARHQIELPAAQVALLTRYCELLWDWNTKLNLTRHTDYEKFVARDLIDSLAFAQFLAPGEKVLDVGSGGGVPGVVLAIVRGDLQISLSESVAKKARVLADIVAAARPANAGASTPAPRTS